MLKELTKGEWLSLLNIPEDRIPKVLALRGTRNLRINYAKHRSFFKNIFEVGSPSGIFKDVLIGDYQNIAVVYASVYGDAMASEITHLFGVLGTSLVIQTGCCGALADGIRPSDVVCATSAHCGEGASQYYLPHKQEVDALPDLVDLITDAPTVPLLYAKVQSGLYPLCLEKEKQKFRGGLIRAILR